MTPLDFAAIGSIPSLGSGVTICGCYALPLAGVKLGLAHFGARTLLFLRAKLDKIRLAFFTTDQIHLPAGIADVIILAAGLWNFFLA